MGAWTALDDRAVTTSRTLAMDAVQKVGNGHPGTAMSLAPVAYLLFQQYLAQDPDDDRWIGRDRFILSNGHSSLTLYVQLYLAGLGLELADLQAFRTWQSKTPGHPEYGHTKAVEVTAGPLGSGLATGVGMAMDSRYIRNLLDPHAAKGESILDHRIWVLAGDGCLQEGITAEASSLAGRQELDNLVVIYDDNHISIEGDTALAFTEDVAARYRAYGWDVRSVDMCADGSVDVHALDATLQNVIAQQTKPVLVAVRNIIGWPAPTLQNTGKIHGSALGETEVAETKRILGVSPEAHFEVPADVLAHTRQAAQRGRAARADWNTRFAKWASANPQAAALLARLQSGNLPQGWQDALPEFEVGTQVATRKASSVTINALAKVLPELWGGSADLGESNLTVIDGGGSFLPGQIGRVVHYGIREHAMGAAMNGIALGGLSRPFAGTFLVFSDYMRGAVRLSALMALPVTFVWTHDSIGVGEDGPTHQPVEHLWALRAIPGLDVIRPADANETALAWQLLLQNRRPAALCLSRQNLPVLQIDRSGVARGAYVLAEATGSPQAVLVATGSEVSLALAARDLLQERGIPTRVVSAPCLEWFAQQPADYQEQVLLPQLRARVAVEAGVSQGWWRYVNDCVSLEHFGASAAPERLYAEYGFTPQAVAARVSSLL